MTRRARRPRKRVRSRSACSAGTKSEVEMGEDAAKAAASAIDADGWGAGKPGDVQAKCPGKCKTMYRIHPAIGVARVGDSPDEFFIGAETDNYKSPENFC